MSRRWLAAALSGLSLGACALTTDLDGLHDPSSGADDSGPDGRSSEGGPEPADADASSAADASTDASADASTVDPSILFQDDFNRPDGPVGNGWVDAKNGYAIVDNRIPITASSWLFQSNTLYRPAAADTRDIEVSIEFTPLAVPPSYPQVHIRAQPGDHYRCYAAGIPRSDNAFFFGRCAPGNNFVSLADQTLSENILVGRTYRLSISAFGDSPVHLVARLERKTDTGFVILGQTIYDDTSADRVREAGMYGISGDTDPNWIYDDFVARKVTE